MKDKKWIAGVLAFMLAMSASGCGVTDNESDETVDETQEVVSEVISDNETTEEGTEDAAVTEAGADSEDAEESDAGDAAEYDTEGTVGNSYIKFVGAETAEGFTYEKSDGSTMVRDKIWFFYDFTNLSDELSNVAGSLDTTITQDGEECEQVYSTDEICPDETGNDRVAVAPGITIRCVTFGYCWYNPEGGDITITMTDSESGSSVSYTVSPDNIPAPTKWSAEIYEDAQWIKEEIKEGTSEEDGISLSIADYEFIETVDGEPAIRFYLEFTNNREVAASFDNTTQILMLQDGIGFKDQTGMGLSTGLDEVVPAEEVEADSVDSAEPGETVTVTVIEKLRTASPFEFAIYGTESGEILCSCVVDIADGYNAIA